MDYTGKRKTGCKRDTSCSSPTTLLVLCCQNEKPRKLYCTLKSGLARLQLKFDLSSIVVTSTHKHIHSYSFAVYAIIALEQVRHNAEKRLTQLYTTKIIQAWLTLVPEYIVADSRTGKQIVRKIDKQADVKNRRAHSAV